MLVGMQICAPTVESSMGYLKKLKRDLPFDPVIPLLGIYSKKLQTLLKKHKQPCIHCSIIYNSQDLEAAQVSTNRRVD